MKITLFICFALFCAIPGKPAWKKMQDKLRLVVKQEGQKDTTFVHIVSGHEKVTDNDFNRAKTAAKLMTQAVDDLAPLGALKSNIGFVQFSRMARIEFQYCQSCSLGQYLDKIDNVVQMKGPTASIGNGLKEAGILFKRYFGTFRVGWLVTNKFGEAGKDAAKQAEWLKNEVGATLLVVGIGKIKRKAELKKLASRKDFFFHFPSYSSYLKAVRDAVRDI